MSVLKFRAWSNEQNIYIGTSHLYLKVSGEFNILDTTIVEQYTGCKDKNGVDIYEGDILEIDDGDGHLNRPEIVVLKDGSFFEGVFDGRIERVIGNIHENPELAEYKG